MQLLILKTSAENEVNVVRVKAIAHRTTIMSIRKLLNVSDTCHFGGARNKFQNAEKHAQRNNSSSGSQNQAKNWDPSPGAPPVLWNTAILA